MKFSHQGLFLCCLTLSVVGQFYNVDDIMGLGRQYDGIGGLSGGSPKFGASLQILKVEIGGDAQASDATEASHMHNAWDENYNRGYEWWLMKEAKKRNPNIKLYGLPWDFPGWIGNKSQNPYNNREVLADYMCRWVNGAKVVHNLTIDYIGFEKHIFEATDRQVEFNVFGLKQIWNERYCDGNFIKVLRQMLDDRGYADTRIVAGDNVWSLFTNVYSDTSVLSSLDVLGSHYPGTYSTEEVILLGKTLWSSEDYSTFNDNAGGGCWARILNQNYVRGLMTSTIAWNLIDSFYQGLPWDRDSLMTAREPWSGNYIVESPIWMSAHTTQLTEIGWHYLPHKHGVGMLKGGGSYVAIVSPDLRDLTIVIETMTAEHSKCIRPQLPPYNVKPQNVTFFLGGSFLGITQLNVWHSKFLFNTTMNSTFFQPLKPVKVVNGIVTLHVGTDEVYSLTTLDDAQHGVFPPPPTSAPFPLPFSDDFESYALNSEPYLLAPQQGSFEVVNSGDQHGQVLRQTVIQTPIAWCSQTLLYNSSLAVLGQMNWTDVKIAVAARVGDLNGSNGIFIGVRIDKGGCGTYAAGGIFLFIYPDESKFLLAADIQGKNKITYGKNESAISSGWNSVTLSVEGLMAVATCNGYTLFEIPIPPVIAPANGFVGLGTDIYGIADFDNLWITNNSDIYVHEDSKNQAFDRFYELEEESLIDMEKAVELCVYTSPDRHQCA